MTALIGMVVTHGRRKSLLDLLVRLRAQELPLDRVHIIVDDCGDTEAPARVEKLIAGSSVPELLIELSTKYNVVGPGSRWLASAEAVRTHVYVDDDIILNFDDDVMPEPSYVKVVVAGLRTVGAPAAVYWAYGGDFPAMLRAGGISGGWTSYYAKSMCGFDENMMRPWLDLREHMTDDITMSAWFHRQKVPIYVLPGKQQFSVAPSTIALGASVPNAWRKAQASRLLQEFGYHSGWLVVE